MNQTPQARADYLPLDMKMAEVDVNNRKLGISRYMVTRVRDGIRQKFSSLVEDAE